MRVTYDSKTVQDISIYLNGELVGNVQAADDEEGWVDQVLTNWCRAIIGYPMAASKEEEEMVVRRTGKVTFKTGSELFAETLEEFAKRLRSGEMVITDHQQTRPYERWWNNDTGLWEFFSTQDEIMTLRYHCPKHQQSEIKRKEAFLIKNPNVEGPIIEPPHPEEVQAKFDDFVTKRKQKLSTL